MKLEVSIGESVDKLTILELKYEKIKDVSKLEAIKNEMDSIQEVETYKTQLPFFYKLLYFVNDQIWIMTDKIKMMDITDPAYSALAYDIFDYNQKRFRLKHFFNKLLDSSIQEQKSYANNVVYIHISNEEILYSKLSELLYLSISYDILYIHISYQSTVSKIMTIPSIHFMDDIVENKIPTIDLAFFSMLEELQHTFSLEPIRYINGGLFGDFIHSLSVINEKYYETGRKGILYISNEHGGDPFRFGLETTFKDTFDIISKQKYIHSYSIYNTEKYDINLNDWRNNPYLFNKNWYDIYRDTYKIEWAKHKWITAPIDNKWKDKVIIHTSIFRYPNQINFQEIYDKYNDNVIFITSKQDEYDFFIQNTKLFNIPLHIISSFTELCIILSSCKLFLGSMSGPLAVAFSIHIPSIICKNSNFNSTDNVMMTNMEDHLLCIQHI